ncbi:MAG: pantoate--beta-alanine ligase, partial [Gammaproteobacteria bacterium]
HIVDSLTLEPADESTTQITLLAAFFLGTTRLIDNLSLTLEK